MSSAPPLAPPASDTVPGAPVSSSTGSSNPFHVDLVIPFDISTKGDRTQRESRRGYELLLRALEGEGGIHVASRPGRAGRGKEEVWVFVGAGEEKVSELVERERWVTPGVSA